jgi:serine/threonine protein kinase
LRRAEGPGPWIAAEAERQERFEREAQSLASLSHPNIVTIYSVEHDGEVRFLTMELIEGRMLSAITPRDGLPLDRLLEVAITLADAIAAAYARGIVHRDLKPANVMVTADARVKVLDFGLAKLKEPVAVGNLTTMAGDLTAEALRLARVLAPTSSAACQRFVRASSDVAPSPPARAEAA